MLERLGKLSDEIADIAVRLFPLLMLLLMTVASAVMIILMIALALSVIKLLLL
jgi:phosphatidylglycerophosphate synthase